MLFNPYNPPLLNTSTQGLFYTIGILLTFCISYKWGKIGIVLFNWMMQGVYGIEFSLLLNSCAILAMATLL